MVLLWLLLLLWCIMPLLLRLLLARHALWSTWSRTLRKIHLRIWLSIATYIELLLHLIGCHLLHLLLLLLLLLLHQCILLLHHGIRSKLLHVHLQRNYFLFKIGYFITRKLNLQVAYLHIHGHLAHLIGLHLLLHMLLLLHLLLLRIGRLLWLWRQLWLLLLRIDHGRRLRILRFTFTRRGTLATSTSSANHSAGRLIY